MNASTSALPKVSFIIPTKNEASVIDTTLASISRYSGPHEIIITDGKSTDDTIALAGKYTDKIIIHQGEKRQTIAEGKNAGAAVATGDFLIFLDSDVVLGDPDAFVRKALGLFEKDADLLALTVPLRVLPHEETYADWIMFHIVNCIYYFLNNVSGKGGASGEFQLFRRSTFKNYGGYNETLAVTEDQEIFWRMASKGKTRFELGLTAYHTGRRAHKVGWPKLIYQWVSNYFSALFFKRSSSAVWEEVR